MSGLPDVIILGQLLDYDHVTGKLTWRERPMHYFRSERDWKRWNSTWANREAFTSLDTHGYRQGSILGRLYLAHRVIWKLMTGQEPPTVDHIDHDRQNNRFANLRAVSRQENAHNQRKRTTNKSGIVGVHFDANSGKWKAQIRRGGMNVHLGLFASLSIATLVRQAAEREQGYHQNHGRN